jgi:hypothetical protein
MHAAFLALALLAAADGGPAPTAPAPAQTAPAAMPGAAGAGEPDTVSPAGLRRQLAEEGTDFAVPLDWAGPAARLPGADRQVQEFDPSATFFGENTGMCVVQRGQPLPPCAQGGPDSAARELSLSDDVFAGGIDNPDATCQTVETVRRGSNGQPERVFATVCGDAAESWDYRQRRTPRSGENPTRPTDRRVGPNEITAPRGGGR